MAARTRTNLSIADALRHSLTTVTKEWTRVRLREERHPARREHRDTYMVRARRMTVKDAAWRGMEAAYLKASANNRYPAQARQVMYAARGPIQERTGRTLDGVYFTQHLLPDYMAEHPEQTAGWRVYFDARGHFAEPHTQVTVPLGTQEVKDYLAAIEHFEIPDPARQFERPAGMLSPTRGPRCRYGAVLFIEKEGFRPLFEAVQLAERFDIAIMSTKGQSVTASRALVDRLCGRGQPDAVPLLVLRDFDKSGFSIVKTLAGDTRRYTFTNDVQVFDLGLRLADVQAEGLDDEAVVYSKSDPRDNLRANGATEEEIAFLCTGQSGGQYRGRRVELNAFTSDAFVRWLEAKLLAHGVTKVVPTDADLAAAFTRSLIVAWVHRQTQTLTTQAPEAVREIPVPTGLQAAVTTALTKTPATSWDEVVAKLARDAVERHAGTGKSVG